MRFRNQLAGAIAIAAALIHQPALASDPLKASCQLIASLVEKGADAGVADVVKMASHWPADDSVKIGALLAPILRKFEYASGDVYLITDMDENVQEHLLVLKINLGGVGYLRLTYERETTGLEFAHVDFQTKLKDLLKTPFGQKPEKLTCN